MRAGRTDPDVKLVIAGLENGDLSRTVREDGKRGAQTSCDAKHIEKHNLISFWKFHPDCTKEDVDRGSTKIMNFSTKQLILFKIFLKLFFLR